MPDPDGGSLYEEAQEFQRALATRDARLASILVDRYAQAYRALRGSFDALALQIQKDIERGTVFTIDRVRRLERYAALMQLVDMQLAEFARYAAREISAQQAFEVREALRRAAELRAAATQQGLLSMLEGQGRGAYPDGADERRIDALFSRLNNEPYMHLIGTMGDGTPLYNYLLNGGANVPGLTPEVIEQIDHVLEQALLEGWNPRKAARMFQDALGVGLTRALAIARTEMMRSYNEATRYEYIQAGVREWEWLATMDLRTCLACIGLDGMRFPISEPMADHVNGRCTMVPVIGDMGPRERRVQWPERGLMTGNGEDWFNSLTDAQKREWMGDGNYNAWKAGAVTFRDFIGMRQNDVFGKSFVQESLVNLLGENAKQYYAR